MKTLSPISVFFTQNGPLPNNTQSIVKPILPKFQGEPKNGYFDKNGTFIFVYNTSVTYDLNTTICNPNGLQTVVIVFDTIHGNLPALIPDYSLLFDNVNGNSNPGSGRVVVYQDGATVNGLTSVQGNIYHSLSLTVSLFLTRSLSLFTYHIHAYTILPTHMTSLSLIISHPPFTIPHNHCL